MLICPGWLESSPCPGLPLTLTVFFWGLFFSFFSFLGRPLYVWSNALCGQGTQQHPKAECLNAYVTPELGCSLSLLCWGTSGNGVCFVWKQLSLWCSRDWNKVVYDLKEIQTGRLFIPLFRMGKGCWGCSPITLIHPRTRSTGEFNNIYLYLCISIYLWILSYGVGPASVDFGSL